MVTSIFETTKKHGNKNRIKYLVEHGTDLKKQNHNDRIPLFTAYRKKNE